MEKGGLSYLKVDRIEMKESTTSFLMHVTLLQAPRHRLIAAVDQRRGREDDPMIRHFSFFLY